MGWILSFRVESLILSIRGRRVILDSDLARLYGVTTARLNEQVKRNPDRFPPDFMSPLSRVAAGVYGFDIAKCDIKGTGWPAEAPECLH